MCGISAYIGNKAVEHVVSALRKLEIRGYDSAGIASWNNHIRILKGIGYVDNVFKTILPNGDRAIGHVRWATNGEVSKANAHPQTDCHGKIAICHNGVIENVEELKALVQDHQFQSETDTEIIAHLLENRDLITGIEEISGLLKGYNSFVVLSEGRIIASCGGPPLVVSKGELASDSSALTSRKFVPLRRGDIVEIVESDFLFHRGTPGVLQSYRWQKKPVGQNQSDLTMFEQEIWSQPEVMRYALDNEVDKLKWVCNNIENSIILTGAGSSKVACMWAKHRFMRSGKFVEVIPAGEWLSRPIPETEEIIAVSQSGETGTLVSLVDMINGTKLKLIAVVNTPWSYLASRADKVLELFCGEERSVIASKSFMAECVVLGQLAAYLGNESPHFEDVVHNASTSLTSWLPELKKEISDMNLCFERCFVCGEGEFYPIAHEGAMKLKEGAYVFAEPMVASEFKHEALPLITKGEVIIWVGETTGGGIAQVAEMRSRGAKVIGIAVRNIGFDVHVKIPRNALAFPPLAVVPLQLITNTIAVCKGINVDRPRNLAKAVTVR